MDINLNQTSKAFIEDLANRMDQMSVDYGNMKMSLDSEEQQFNQSNNSTVIQSESLVDEVCDDETTRQQQQHITRNDTQADGNMLIVTQIDPLIFDDHQLRTNFESIVRQFDTSVQFRYLKSFSRVRLDFSTNGAAKRAQPFLDNYQIGNSAIRCYLTQMIKMPTNRDSQEIEDSMRVEEGNIDATPQAAAYNLHLNVPKRTKQFLISPPASPPVGWEPVTESSPCIDVQLMSALANLVPGQMHELHAGSESQPGIFVEVCEEPKFESRLKTMKNIPKTPSPCFQMQQ